MNLQSNKGYEKVGFFVEFLRKRARSWAENRAWKGKIPFRFGAVLLKLIFLSK